MSDLKFVPEAEGGQNRPSLHTSASKKSGKTKKTRGKKTNEAEDLGAVPPHIMRIMETVESKQRMRIRNDGQQAPDSVSIFKNMMASVRTKVDLDEAGEEVRQDKENDIQMITNARNIFRTLETEEDQTPQRAEKHKRVEVKPDFMLSGVNKAEEMRKNRLKEMATMRMAREQTLEEEANWNKEQKQKADAVKRQREMELEVMKMARQQAIEEEERLEQETRPDHRRQVSPGLEAAKNVMFQTRDLAEDGMNKIEKMRLEREREIEAMKRARELMMDEEDEERQDGRSEASRELEAFRASKQAGGVKERYRPVEEVQGGQVARAPRSRVKTDNWMSNCSQNKEEEARLQREREIELMMNARAQAIEEEEQERVVEEAERRMEAERKAREMAILVADLQRMRSETANSLEEEEKMTRYQEEMVQRVMELHAIQRDGVVTN